MADSCSVHDLGWVGGFAEYCASAGFLSSNVQAKRHALEDLDYIMFIINGLMNRNPP